MVDSQLKKSSIKKIINAKKKIIKKRLQKKKNVGLNKELKLNTNIEDNTQLTIEINKLKIQFGINLCFSLIKPSIHFSHIFGYLNEFLMKIIQTDKNIESTFNNIKPELDLFLILIRTLLEHFKYQKNEFESFVKLNIKHYYKNEPILYIQNNIYQLGIDTKSFNGIHTFIDQNQNEKENKDNFLLVKKIKALYDKNLIIHNNNLGLNTFSIQKLNINKIEMNKNNIIEFEKYASMFYEFLLQDEDEKYILSILSSFLINLLYENNNISLEKIVLKHLKNKNNATRSIHLCKEGSESAKIIISRLWGIIDMHKDIFPQEAQSKINAINTFGGIVKYFEKKINPEEKSRLLPKAIKIAAAGVLLGTSLYGANKLIPGAPIHKAASFAFKHGSNLIGNIKNTFNTWRQETNMLHKVWDISTGKWIKKAVEKPIHYGVKLFLNKSDGILSEKIGTNGTLRFIGGMAISGISIGAQTLLQSKLIKPIANKIGSKIYEFNPYEKAKNILGEFLNSKKIEYEYEVDSKKYINNSLLLYKFIQAASKIELYLIYAEENEKLNTLTNQGLTILESLFKYQISSEKDNIAELKLIQNIKTAAIEEYEDIKRNR